MTLSIREAKGNKVRLTFHDLSFVHVHVNFQKTKTDTQL